MMRSYYRDNKFGVSRNNSKIIKKKSQTFFALSTSKLPADFN